MSSCTPEIDEYADTQPIQKVYEIEENKDDNDDVEQGVDVAGKEPDLVNAIDGNDRHADEDPLVFEEDEEVVENLLNEIQEETHANEYNVRFSNHGVSFEDEGDGIEEEEVDHTEPGDSNEHSLTIDEDIPPPPKKPFISAYALFAHENRNDIAKDYKGKPVTVVAKAIGAKWNELTEEEKLSYSDRLKEIKAKYTADLAEYEQKYNVKVNKDGKQQKKSSGSVTNPNSKFEGISSVHEDESFFPLGTLKRLLAMDPENGRISKDAMILISKAAEFFVVSCAKGCFKMAALQKRKTIRLSDLLYLTEQSSKYEFARALVKEIHHANENDKHKDDKENHIHEANEMNTSGITEKANTKTTATKKRKASEALHSHNIASMFSRAAVDATSDAIIIDETTDNS